MSLCFKWVGGKGGCERKRKRIRKRKQEAKPEVVLLIIVHYCVRIAVSLSRCLARDASEGFTRSVRWHYPAWDSEVSQGQPMLPMLQYIRCCGCARGWPCETSPGTQILECLILECLSCWGQCLIPSTVNLQYRCHGNKMSCFSVWFWSVWAVEGQTQCLIPSTVNLQYRCHGNKMSCFSWCCSYN